MSWATDVSRLGIMALQHFDRQVGPNSTEKADVKILAQAARYQLDPQDDEAGFVTIEGTRGPVVGGMAWDGRVKGVDAPYWSWVFPVRGQESEEPEESAEPATGNSTVARVQGISTGGFGIQSQTQTSSTGGQSTISPQSHKMGREFIPQMGPDWGDDDPNLKVLTAAVPEGLPDLAGWPGLVVRGTDQNAQHNMFLPAGGVLTAPHWGGKTADGTPVFDVTSNGAIDRDRRARLQSLTRTYLYPPDQPTGSSTVTRAASPTLNKRFSNGDETSGLAIQLGTARSGIAGLGVFADLAGAADAEFAQVPALQPAASPVPTRTGMSRGSLQAAPRGFGGFGQGIRFVPAAQPMSQGTPSSGGVGPLFTAKQTLGIGSPRASGFMNVGAFGCRHLLATNADGENFRPLHIDTNALHLGNGWDVPLEYSGAYIPPRRAPYIVPTWLRRDERLSHQWAGGTETGLGRWESETYFTIGEPPDGTVPRALAPPRDPIEGNPQDPCAPIPGLEGPGTINVSDKGFIAEDSIGPLGEEVLPDGTLVNENPYITRQSGTGRRSVHTQAEVHFAATGGRPQHFRQGAIDLRNAAEDANAYNLANLRGNAAAAPVVLRKEFLGVQSGDRWEYTYAPGAAGNRHNVWTGDGWEVILPPELGLEDPSTDREVSESGQMHFRTRLGFGRPGIDGDLSGKLYDGGYFYRDDTVSPPLLKWDYVDSSAAVAHTLTHPYRTGVLATVDQTVTGILTTMGDIVYHDGTGPARLGIGAASEVLTAVGGIPSWQPSSGGGVGTGVDLIYGDGSDGTVTIVGTVTLTRDMYYDDLTVPASTELITNGWRVFVMGTLTVAVGGVISNDGGNGGAGVGGTGGGLVAPGSGIGGSLGAGEDGAPGSGNPTVTPGNSTTRTKGGSGGAGGSVGGNAGGAGGSVTDSKTNILDLRAAITMEEPQNDTSAVVTGLYQGGSGGGSGYSSDAGVGGSGGGGGGVIAIYASEIGNSGTIRAIGGDGSAPPAGADRAGGGGGGGGALVIVSRTPLASRGAGTFSVAGGSGGAGTGLGTVGSDGSDGNIYQLLHDPSGSTVIGEPVPVKVSVAANHSASFDTLVCTDSSGGAFTVTLPDAATATNAQRVIIKDENGSSSGANRVTVATQLAQTIDSDGTTRFLPRGDSLAVRSTGSNWLII